MKKIKIAVLFFTIFLFFWAGPKSSFAKTDISVDEKDITFSKTALFDGDLIKVYARVFNSGDNDVSGYVVFLNNGKEMAGTQPISLKPNTYDDVFIDWKAKAGTYNIEVKIIGLNPADDSIENNQTIKKTVFIDLDTDKDGIGDSKDPDTDGDGLTNEEEKIKGTNPLMADTDGDKVNDKIDAFPTDKTEWHDTNNNDIGDNKDPDADGDGLTNLEEIQKYGTNPLNPDSDNDGLNDKQEVLGNTDPNKPDANSGGVADTKNTPFFDISKTGASLMGSVAGLFNTKNPAYLIGGAIAGSVILFFLFRKKKRRRGA